MTEPGNPEGMIREAIQGAGETLLRPASLVSSSFRQREILESTDHRPWPLPRQPWLMGQVWIDLVFAHWPVAPESLERVVPPELPIDIRDGSAWLGITPFRVEGLRLRGGTPIPAVSSFAEINVRTYVTVDGKPGIYFLSLDTSSWPAVHAARLGYRLPYFHARIAHYEDLEGTCFDINRSSGDGPPAFLRAKYGPDGDPLPVRPGSLERWLTERYCLYTLDERHRVYRGDIHHMPWPLTPAWMEIESNAMARPHGIELEGDPIVHFSRRQDVALWPIEPLPPRPD